MLRKGKGKLIYVVAAACWLLIAIATLSHGSASSPQVWHEALARLRGHTTDWNPLFDERLPRLIVLLCTGASLAVSGVVMQSIFRNPLASPMVLGLTSGGSLLVLFTFLLEWHLSFPFSVPLAAFIGCLLALLTVYNSARQWGEVNMTRLILAGIALSTVLVAIQGAALYAFRDHWSLVQTFSEWEAGSTTYRSWSHVHLQLPVTLVGLFGCWTYRNEINILTLGDEEALSLGVEVSKVRWRLFLCICLLTGGALAAMGVIAFFGLVLPHMLRSKFGPDHRNLIPLCILIGSPTLALLDLLLRALSLHQLSIGNVSAILGGIFFLALLLRTHQPQQVSTHRQFAMGHQ